MRGLDDKQVLQRYLDSARNALLWKLEGLSEYDARRPLTSSGTNLLGLVKHLATVEFGYFGDTFGRPHGEQFPWDDRALDFNEDMFASADETRGDIIGLYRRAIDHANTTIEERTLDSEGRVPWWPDDVNPVTLQGIIVHMIAETNRHLGHADVLREEIDGEIGLRAENTNVPPADPEAWAAYVAHLEEVARSAMPE